MSKKYSTFVLKLISIRSDKRRNETEGQGNP